jgi:lysozyme
MNTEGPSLEDLVAEFIGPLEAANGPVLSAYQDEAGIWTIGYGTTYYGPMGDEVAVVEGLVWTPDQCMAALIDYVTATVSFVVSVNTLHPWSDNEIIAMCSLAYNIGNKAFRGSSVLKFHNEGQGTAAAQAFLLWDKDHQDGKLVESAGLLNRRKIEMAKYLGNLT